MVKKKKSQKSLNLLGIKLDYNDYVERFIPEQVEWHQKLFNKIGIDFNYKPVSSQKTKYWDLRNIYPKTTEDFKKKFFSKRKPKDIEGIWEQVLLDQSAFYGVVKNGKDYHSYYIEVNWDVQGTTGSFFKDIFSNPGKINYKILNGTKFGIFSPTKNKKYFKFKGISTSMSTKDKHECLPFSYALDYDVTLVHERELRGESEAQIKLEKLGISRSAHKLWPEMKYKKVPKDHPGFKKYGERKKEIEEKSNSGTSAGSGFFVTNKGHIVTNYHVVQNRKDIKFLYNDEEISAKLISSDQQLDLALLKAKIKNKNFIKFSNESPKKAQSILVAGFPHAKAVSDDLIITGGIINSLKGAGNNTSMLQIDANINRGNSGGPIVDKNTGNLVAVATMKLIGKDSSIENMSFGIKSSQVRDFLEANNLKVTVKKNKFNVSDLESSTLFIYCK